jgi:hypothetical protein
LLAGTVTIMTADEALEVLPGLVAGAIRAPEEEAPRGASPAEIDSLRASLGCDIPPALRTWLAVCRGAGIGPGGVFGQRPDRPFLDMPQRRDSFPEWAERGWLPVAGDGCGNYYVLTADGAVGFVDTMKDPGQIDRQAAGDLLSFMTGLLAADQDADRTRALLAAVSAQATRFAVDEDELDFPLGERLLAVAEAEHLCGSPVAGRDSGHRQEMVKVAMRRWRSFSRRSRHPERATHAERVEDLAKGLRDHFEVEPPLTGPLMTDYRYLAAKLSVVLANPLAG